MDELRPWKWLAPGLMACALLFFQLMLNDIARRSGTTLFMLCGYGTFPMIALLLVQAWAGFRAYYRQIETDQFVSRRSAQANTAEVRLFEASRGMHPEALRLLLKHRIEVWRIKELPAQDLLLAVLDADPRITLPFLEYVLRNSNPYSIMANRTLSDKAHTHDPRGLFTDYQQYKALHELMERRGWLTTAFGNQPGQWIEPWNPELVARKFGIELYEEEQSDKNEEAVLAPRNNINHKENI